MQEPTFLILTALAAGAQHGDGIMSDVARISDGRVRLRAGTLYAALDRLKSDGMVTSDKEEVVDGRLRRYYRITDEGAAELAAQAGLSGQRRRRRQPPGPGRGDHMTWSAELEGHSGLAARAPAHADGAAVPAAAHPLSQGAPAGACRGDDRRPVRRG